MKKFDVFLSHNSNEKSQVIVLAKIIKDLGFRVWLDIWELRPGLSWQDGFAEGLMNSLSCAILIGKSVMVVDISEKCRLL